MRSNSAADGLPAHPSAHVEQQVLRQPPLLLRNRREPLQLLRVHDRQVQPGLRAVVQEDRVHHFSRAAPAVRTRCSKSPASSAYRQRFLDQPNAFDRLHRAADVVGVARGARKHQRVEDDILRRNPVLLRQQLVRPLRHRQLALARERLRLQLVLVDAAHHQRRAVVVRDRHHVLELLLAVFQVDRVDDALPLAVGQRQLHRRRIGGVDHDRRLDLADQLLVERRDVLHLVAVRALQAHVHDVRAVLHLPARDLGGLFPLLFRHQVLEQPRPDHVGPLAHDQRPRLLVRFHRLDARVDRAMRLRRPHPRLLSLHHLRDRADVRLRGAAASAHDIQPAVIDEFLQLRRQRVGVSRYLPSSFGRPAFG